MKLNRETLVIVVVVVWAISERHTAVLSCPPSCNCRGVAAKCGSGLKSFPAGLDASLEVLSIVGSLTQPNAISALRKSDFQGTTSIFSLSMIFCGIETVENEAFSTLSNLHELNLADNDIKTLTADTFKGMSKLRSLDLSGNKNCKFDKSIFQYITTLEELSLGNMNINTLDKDFFSALTNLKVLKLYMNELEKIHEDVLAPLTNLKTIDLKGNHLVGLPVELKPMLQGMTQVHISQNLWQCNCQLLWLRELPESFVSSRTDSSEIICNGPQNLKYHSFVNVPESDFICIPPKVLRCEHARYSQEVSTQLVISCAYQGDPVPEIKWTRPGGFLIDGRETVSGKYEIFKNGTLKINSLSSEDEGDWTVTAYNKTSHDDQQINVHVIVTTTSTSTTTTTTTTPSTTIKTTTPVKTLTTKGSIQSSTGSVKLPSQSLSSIFSQRLPSAASSAPQQQLNPGKATQYPYEPDTSVSGSTQISPSSTEAVSKDNTQIVYKDNGINYGLLAAAAAGGGTIVGIICIIVMCCKKKQNDKNKVVPFVDDYNF